MYRRDDVLRLGPKAKRQVLWWWR